MRVVGIDLAGVEKRPSGFCLLDDMRARTSILYKDGQLILKTIQAKPDLVAIDAPLALPRGRCCLRDDCGCRKMGHFREADLEMRKLGIKFFPVTLGPMRKLTLRGIKLKAELERVGLKVIEVFPGGAQDLLRIPRVQEDAEKLRMGLIELGLKGDVLKSGLSNHELDAITCALIGKYYLDGNYRALGDPDEIQIIMPKIKG